MPVSAVAQVVERNGNSAVVCVSKAACTGCLSRCDSRQFLSLPVTVPDRVRLGVTRRDLALMLWHSLGLPLAGFVAGAFVANALNAADWSALIGGMAGMWFGVVACRKQDPGRIQIIKAE